MDSPCFDVKTKTDCPDRKKGCAITCKKWADYVIKREANYALRKQIVEATGAYTDTMGPHKRARMKKIINNRQCKRRK